MGALLEPEVERMTRSKLEFYWSARSSLGWKAHLHPAVEILFFTLGEHRVAVDGMTFTAKPGDMILMRSNAEHEVSKDPDTETRHYALKLHPELLFSSFADVPHAYVMQLFGKSTRENTYFPAERIPACILEQRDRMIGLLGDNGAYGNVEKQAKKDVLLFANLRNEAIRLVLLMFRYLLPPAGDAAGSGLDRQMV